MVRPNSSKALRKCNLPQFAGGPLFFIILCRTSTLSSEPAQPRALLMRKKVRLANL
jgi:hypothetical protein